VTAHEFVAPRWIHGGHAQTIGGRLLRGTAGVHFRRERLDTPDGDFLDLEYATVDHSPLPADAPLILMLHGLEGSAHSGYAVQLALALARCGVRMVGLNFRSCGGDMNRAARYYHSGETGDLALVLDHLGRQTPPSRLGAVGFSLGGNVLIKYLGEEGGGATRRLRTGAAISVPYDLGACADHMSHGAGRIYAGFFLRSLRKKVIAKEIMLAGVCDVPRVLQARTVREFDDRLTAPLHGFADAEDYYRRSSAAQFLPAVAVPTLLVHAMDDPIALSSAIPDDVIRANPAISADFPETGGHVGFVGGPGPWAPTFWAENRVAHYLSAAFKSPQGVERSIS
jgi:predicted alpha/beta-fold hydrolase